MYSIEDDDFEEKNVYYLINTKLLMSTSYTGRDNLQR